MTAFDPRAYTQANPETARLVASHDWGSSPLGPIEDWPPELMVPVRLMLASTTPQRLVWGPEQTLIYNDHYVPFLEERHPGAMGARLRDVWPDAWDELLRPANERAYAGEALVFEDQPVVLRRGRDSQRIWVSFAYAPVRDGDGNVLGVHSTLHETTEKVLAARRHVAQNERLSAMFDQSPGFVALLSGPDHIFELANQALLRLIGGRDLVGKRFADALPEAVEQGFLELLDRVYETGEPLVVSRRRYEYQADPDGAPEVRYVDFVYQPIVGPDGRSTGIFVAGSDVTEHFHAEEELREMTQSALHSARQAESERRRIEALVHAAPVGIACADANGRIVLLNGKNREIWGRYPDRPHVADNAAWKGWWADGSARHGQPIEGRDWAMARALRGDEVHGDVVEIEPFDEPGRRKTLLMRAAPVRAADGRLDGGVLIQVDISEQVRVESELRASEAKFRGITEALPQMVWSTRADGYGDYFSRQWYEFIGELDGASDDLGWARALHPDDRERARAAWRHSVATGDPYEIEYRLRHRSGDYRWVLSRGVPVRDEAGDIVRWMGTSTDIHQHKLAESALLESDRALREADRRKDEFLAMLAHELRNPLAPISTAATLLSAPDAPPQVVRRASEIIARQVTHITELVDDLLDVSRVTRGLVELDRRPFDVKSAVRAALEQVRPTIEGRNHTLATRMTATPLWVDGDATRMTQVVANLVNNAAKYTPPGGNIHLEVTAADGAARIAVSDNGIGMVPDLVPHVFELFTQGKRSADRSQGGLGIGLALVKSIVALHGGRVDARSDGLGCGSTFSVEVPLVDAPRAAGPAEATCVTSPGRARALRIIVVDDNADAAETLAALLESDGHDVRTFGSAHSLLDCRPPAVADVFILDIGLPGMTGYELAERLRADPRTSAATLFALTGYGQAHDRAASDAAGFDRHFVKPIAPQRLLDALASVAARGAEPPAATDQPGDGAACADTVGSELQ